jgi:hypothetical protein
MKDDKMIVHPITRRTDQSMDHVRKLVGNDRRVNIRIVPQELNAGRRPGICLHTSVLNHNLPLLITRSLSWNFWSTNLLRNWKIYHICHIWSRTALVIAKSANRFERPRIFRLCDIHEHATTILKSIPEEGFQQYFERWKHGLTKSVAEQVDYF